MKSFSLTYDVHYYLKEAESIKLNYKKRVYTECNIFTEIVPKQLDEINYGRSDGKTSL